MYDLRLNNAGGILGDDMGLGKTFQTASLITGLIRFFIHNIMCILLYSYIYIYIYMI